MRARWIDRANEYLILADALGDDPVPELPPNPLSRRSSSNSSSSSAKTTRVNSYACGSFWLLLPAICSELK